MRLDADIDRVRFLAVETAFGAYGEVRIGSALSTELLDVTVLPGVGNLMLMGLETG